MNRQELLYRLIEAYVNLKPDKGRFWMSENLYVILYPEADLYTRPLPWRRPFLDMELGLSRETDDRKTYEPGVVEYYIFETRKYTSRGMNRYHLG